MSKNYNIQNLNDLQDRLITLKIDYQLQEDKIKTDVRIYARQFSPGNLIKKYATPSAFFKVDDKLNISSKLMSMILPVLMNNTLFRGSGFITKTLVGLATSKVGKTLDAEHLSSIFKSVKGMFSRKKNEKKPAYVDYGIPPDSETY